MLENDFIQKVKEANDIVDVIGEDLTLVRSGVNYKGLCPFHDDHSPSMVVSKSRQTFKCFVCGMGGDVVKYVQQRDQCSFIEALRTLASRAHIEWPHKQADDEQLANYRRRESQLTALKAAAEFFQNNIVQAQSFLASRGYQLHDKALADYGVGYAPAGNMAMKWLTDHGYDPVILTAVDVLKHKPDTADTYDTFRDRLMFPFYDLHGRVLGFSGRQVTPNERSGKYVNTGETPVFTKGRNIFGLYQAKKSIAQKGFAYLVEGQFDVMSLHQCGVENVIGGSGTAFTDDQVRLIMRFTQRVVMIYDADQAGIKAALKNTEILLKAGCQVSCIRLPQGKDPDNFAQENRENTGKLLLDRTETFPHAFRRLLVPRGCKDSNVINDAINAICSLIACIADQTSRITYMTAMAKDFETKFEAIEQNVAKSRANLPAANSVEMTAGLYGLEDLKDKLEPDQPAILTSDLDDFIQRFDDDPVVMVAGLIDETHVQKLRRICGFFTASSSGCKVGDDCSPSPYLASLIKMYRGGITKITVVDGEQVWQLLDFYINLVSVALKTYNGGERVRIISDCIELSTYADDAVITINRNSYCSKLGITKGQFDDIRKPFATARKSERKTATQSDGLVGVDSVDPDELPSYVTENSEYMEMYKQYKFFPLVNKQGEPVSYMFDDKNGNGRSIVGDFYMTPLLHIFSDNYDQNKRVLRINRRYYNTPIYIEVKSTDLLKMSSIESVLINYEAVNFSNGEEWKWKKIREYMSRHFTLCQELEVYGNQQTLGTSRDQDEQFFAFANGIAHFIGDTYVFEPVNDLGVCSHNNKNYYLPSYSSIFTKNSKKKEEYEYLSKIVYREVPKEKQVSFSEWAALMNEVYKVNDNGKWALIFAVMCAFRSNIHCIDRLFTAPFFKGKTSSGKTTIAISIRSLFMTPHESAINLNATTDQAVIRLMGVFRDVPMILDEYNNNNVSDMLFQALKSIVYDGESRQKSKANSSTGVESNKILSPVILCGQDVPERDDNSLITRCIICEVPQKHNYTARETEVFNRLKTIEDPEKVGLSNVLMRILRLRPLVMDHYRDLRNEAYEKLKEGKAVAGERDRLTRTVSLFLGMVYLLERYAPDMKLPFTSEEFFELCSKKIDVQIGAIQQSDYLAKFFTSVSNLIDEKKIIEGRDFCIVESNGRPFTAKDYEQNVRSFQFDAGVRIMYLRLANIFGTVQRFGYNTDKTTISTIEQNLRSHPSFIGAISSRRFRWEEIVEMGDLNNAPYRTTRQMTNNSSCVAINYDVFTKYYNIDFRRSDAAPERDPEKPASADTPAAASTSAAGEKATVPGSSAAGSKSPVQQDLPFTSQDPDIPAFF